MYKKKGQGKSDVTIVVSRLATIIVAFNNVVIVVDVNVITVFIVVDVVFS